MKREILALALTCAATSTALAQAVSGPAADPGSRTGFHVGAARMDRCPPKALGRPMKSRRRQPMIDGSLRRRSRYCGFSEVQTLGIKP
jgi:hypothetical protein